MGGPVFRTSVKGVLPWYFRARGHPAGPPAIPDHEILAPTVGDAHVGDAGQGGGFLHLAEGGLSDTRPQTGAVPDLLILLQPFRLRPFCRGGGLFFAPGSLVCNPGATVAGPWTSGGSQPHKNVGLGTRPHPLCTVLAWHAEIRNACSILLRCVVECAC